MSVIEFQKLNSKGKEIPQETPCLPKIKIIPVSITTKGKFLNNSHIYYKKGLKFYMFEKKHNGRFSKDKNEKGESRNSLDI